MARSQVEQAKGVLAYVEGFGMAEAYDELRRLAAERGHSLTETSGRSSASSTRGIARG